MENKIVEDGLNKNKLERFEFFFKNLDPKWMIFPDNDA